jgi:hypothetical protein
MQKIEPTRLSTEESLTTSTYLMGLSAQFQSIAVEVQSLFGRCCLASAFDLGLDELGAEAEDLGSRILDHPEPDRLDLDPLLLIEIDQMFKAVGISIATLRILLLRVASLLQTQPAETQQVGRVRNVAAHLASVGLAIRPAKKSREMAHLVDSPDRWFGCSVAQLSEVSDHLIADGEPLDEISTSILSLLALAELRNYRVDLGCTLLRTVFELGVPAAESTEALNFIALQRRRDGRYGFPNQFVEGAKPENDPHLTMFLPLTVNAVWLFRVEAQHRQRMQARRECMRSFA